MKTASRIVAVVALALAGCDSLTYTLPAPPAAPADTVSRFDPAECGSVAGVVTWAGERPGTLLEPVPLFNLSGVPAGAVPNPNAPAFGPDGGVTSAVVYLRGVDPTRAKPWHLPPVNVYADNYCLYVRQGHAAPGRVGFVQAGQAVRFESITSNLVGVRAGGAAFFSLVFPPNGRPVDRVFREPGRVELSSASGQFWAAAELFVSGTPYLARPDAGGRFVFENVPSGEYELVVWHPNWCPGPADRDPETGAFSRRRYAAGVEKVRRVRVEAGRASEVRATLSKDEFPSK